jgi:translocation protein SEC63
MAASEDMSSLFPIFILSVLGLIVVPWTLFRVSTAASAKGKNLHCRCSECMRSPKYQTSLLKRVSGSSCFGQHRALAGFMRCVQ